jgi:tRNA-2-methylthio-N6-dimethylallyladenosine synthase
MNERDSETLAGICEALGLSRCDDPADAQVAILNTCAVREKPQERVYSRLGELRKLGRKRGGPIVVVAGCVAQIAAEELRRRGADIVVGPRCYDMLKNALEETLLGVSYVEGDDRPVVEGLPAARESDLKAFVNVIYGCDNFCAYCIVPYARGREQSRTPDDVLAEVREVVAAGARDITLLGQNVNSYGHDLPRDIDFAELMRRVDAVEGLDRLRFTTSHPKDMTQDLIDTMASLPSACEHLHLPIQAGSDAVLRAMGRGYTYAHFRSLIHAARGAMPGLSVTTDVMVGFPGETEADFEDTMRAFEEIRFDQAFMFKYNDRPGTRAESMEPKVPEEEKQRRLVKLVALQNEMAREINVALEGEVFEVLVEEPDPKSEGHVRGRTRQQKLMIFPGPESLIGEVVPVRAIEGYLWGWMGKAAGEGL